MTRSQRTTDQNDVVIHAPNTAGVKLVLKGSFSGAGCTSFSLLDKKGGRSSADRKCYVTGSPGRMRGSRGRWRVAELPAQLAAQPLQSHKRRT